MSQTDKSRIVLTLKDTNTGNEVYREIGVPSAFNFGGYKTKDRFIQDWIETRGNPQHNTKLEYVSWEYFNSLNTSLVA
jgi:hypothetical protein